MLAVILNPHARGAARDPALPARLRTLLGARGQLFVARTTEELAATVEQLAAAGCTGLATCGGDGTNLATLSEAIRRFGADRLPTFALLRGGTLNTVAANLGIRGQPEELLRRLLAASDAGATPRTVEQDLIEVDGRFGFLFAAGMGARFLEAYYGGGLRGPAWAGVLAARTLTSSLVNGRFARWLFAPAPCVVHADGELQPITDARLVLASVVRDVGIGMRVTWQAGREAGRFHLVVSSLSTPAMAVQLGRVMAGRPLVGKPHVDRLAREVTLRFESEQSYTLDGDMFRARAIAIRIGPRIRIVAPGGS